MAADAISNQAQISTVTQEEAQGARKSFGVKPLPEDRAALTQEPSECEVCGLLFSTQDKLRVHVYSHTGQKPYHCSQPDCSKAFVSKYKLFRHMATHSPQKTHQCTFCEKMFHRKDHLKNHLQTHDPNKEAFKCEECGKNYNTKMGYKRHIAMHAATSGDLTCKVCMQSYESTPVLLEHLKSHSGKSSGSVKEKKHPCDHCDRHFYTRKDVRRHMVVHTGRKDFLCQYCAQRFGRKDHLTRHVKKSHSQELLKIKTEPQDMLGILNCGSSVSVKEELTPMMCMASSKDSMMGKSFSNTFSVGMYNPHLPTMSNSGMSHTLVPSSLASMGMGCPMESPPSHHHSPPPQQHLPPKYQLGSTSYLPEKPLKVEMESFLMDLQSGLPISSPESHPSPPKVGLEHHQSLDDLPGDHIQSKSPTIITEPFCAANMDFSHLLSFLPLNLPPYNPPMSTSGLVMGYPSQGDPQPPLTSLQPQPQESQGAGSGLSLGPLHPLPPVFTTSLSTTTLPRFHQAFQ
ncbi:zinc finger protein PLAGL2 isoform X1 [Polypterus senegalus]|nr:zinc finger protein PLAGL2 isoform X1 [Polypterus senegalus]XP_039591368.1 zinc finger protein PLAGL2 isoform X1 [Polypterus senegalus]